MPIPELREERRSYLTKLNHGTSTTEEISDSGCFAQGCFLSFVAQVALPPASMATSTNPPVRVGWLSTASIGRKNSWALKLAGGVPAVVGSRSLAKAQEYAKAWGFERAVGSYEEVISDPSVDAVYIPLPTGLRVEWALKAIAAGKSVLMDKPTATSLDGMMSVVAAAKAKGVALMDGVMFMHNARQEAIAEYLWAGESGPLGSPRIVSSVFGFNADEEWQNSNIRTDPTLEPAG